MVRISRGKKPYGGATIRCPPPRNLHSVSDSSQRYVPRRAFRLRTRRRWGMYSLPAVSRSEQAFDSQGHNSAAEWLRTEDVPDLSRTAPDGRDFRKQSDAADCRSRDRK